MPKHNHKVGDIVEVFDDPTTPKDSQGRAKIVFVVPETDHYYKVIFLNDPEAAWVGRFIF